MMQIQLQDSKRELKRLCLLIHSALRLRLMPGGVNGTLERVLLAAQAEQREMLYRLRENHMMETK